MLILIGAFIVVASTLGGFMLADVNYGRGQVVGMNTLIYTGGQTNTYIGYGFAIPINKVKKIVADLTLDNRMLKDVNSRKW